jgi:hypothetical protein
MFGKSTVAWGKCRLSYSPFELSRSERFVNRNRKKHVQSCYKQVAKSMLSKMSRCELNSQSSWYRNYM